MSSVGDEPNVADDELELEAAMRKDETDFEAFANTFGAATTNPMLTHVTRKPRSGVGNESLFCVCRHVVSFFLNSLGNSARR